MSMQRMLSKHYGRTMYQVKQNLNGSHNCDTTGKMIAKLNAFKQNSHMAMNI